MKKKNKKRKEKKERKETCIFYPIVSRSKKKQQNDLRAKRRLGSDQPVHPPSLIIVFAWVAYSVGASYYFGTW